MQKIVLNNIQYIQSQFVLLSSFSDITAWAKDSEGRFVAVNQTFLNRYGMSRQSEIEGKDDYDLHPKSHADQYRADDERVLTGCHIDDRQEVIPYDSLGLIWISTSKRPIYNTTGKIIGTFGYSKHLNSGANAAKSNELDAAISYIKHHYGEKLTITSLAAAMNLSVSALERKFKKYLMQTPRQYITEVRLNRAHDLLLNTNKAISVIAQETGFSDNSHLTRCFIQRFAITPKAARR